MCFVNAFAQSYTFEESSVPSQWISANGGNLALSIEHYKEGYQSLEWTTNGTTNITVSFTSFSAAAGNSAFMYIYSPQITYDTLQVEFLYNATVKKKAIYLVNYKGWHEFNRAYTEYALATSATINTLRITIKPTSQATRILYFDAVNLNRTTDAARMMGSHWVLEKQYFGSTSDTSSLSLFANPIDIPVVSPTAQELSALTSLQNTLKRTATAGNSTDLAAAKAYVTSLNIIRNSDGTVSGNVIDASMGALTTTFMTDIAKKVEILAADALKDANTMTLFRNFVDHLLDQGISEGCNLELASNNYNPCRDIPNGFLDAMSAYSPEQKVEILKLIRWISFYGTMYYPQNDYLSKQVSDIIYLFLPTMMAVALNQQDNATCVRELKAFKRYLDRNTEYTPGGKDILKPDGTGFHHNTNYNNYMYAYKTWVDYIYNLRGTSFKINADSYQRFKKAVLTVYTMGTNDTGDVRYFANSLSGRKPFDTNVQFTKAQFEKLISVGADCLGTNDTDLEASYNFFFKTTKYSTPAKSYEGFHQFNYSPIGIYRKANWVATMRAPTTKFFGAEIYDKTNRFGRYQSHGALEIMYEGTLDASGYITNGTGGGWDWNVIPGTTTVQYTSWLEMMPNKNLTDRFDQYTKTKNFAGALSMGDCGMFACDFDQIDTWGGQRYTATNLAFKKSMFAFDNMIISLGSDISSSGTYSSGMITSTNLFQNIMSGSSGNFIYNGTTLTSPYNASITMAADKWLITPQGTGYFIPAGNDPLQIKFGSQTTPMDDGSDYAAPTTTVAAAKAYLNHGVKPSAKSYSFVAVPATNSTSMATLAAQMANGGGSIYQILSQNGNVHALLYKPLNITAYSFFTSASDLTYGIVKSTTAPHLLMDKYDANVNRHYFAVSDPNLHPISDAVYGWLPVSSQTTLTLLGSWIPISNVEGVTFSAPSSGLTQIQIKMYNGEPIYFGVKSTGDTTSIQPIKQNNWVQFTKSNEAIHLSLSEISAPDLEIKIYSSIGKIVYDNRIANPVGIIDISTSKLNSGILFCTVSTVAGTKTFKWVN
ncbi:MAG: polysaccharide lyase family 8 super-sandwich domain-containing protein [Bacteroidales bacterium]|nr:polysaccharide lyase family 8 super-sandwich domain-containing protein [Bacteroidales bacterium]